MTPAFRSPDFDPTASTAIITRSLRGWRKACDAGLPVQPQLFQALHGQGYAMLAPVLDSLFRFYQAALERPLVVGDAEHISEDERLLLDFVGCPELCRLKLDCPTGIALGFNCALCSTRIMLALALQSPPGGARLQ